MVAHTHHARRRAYYPACLSAVCSLAQDDVNVGGTEEQSGLPEVGGTCCVTCRAPTSSPNIQRRVMHGCAWVAVNGSAESIVVAAIQAGSYWVGHHVFLVLSIVVANMLVFAQWLPTAQVVRTFSFWALSSRLCV